MFFLSLVDAVDCVWNEFGEWSACTKTCGGGKRSRTRTIKIEASNGGRKCNGLTREEENCNTLGCKGNHSICLFHVSNLAIEANEKLHILHFTCS